MVHEKPPWHLLACKGCGSAIVELAFALTNTPYEREEVNYDSDEGRARLAPFNPLMQVPTLIGPDGTVMTESLAIILSLDDPQLVPPRDDPSRAQALRWLTFLVTAIYPTFTYGDDTSKWGGGAALRESTDAHRKKLWQHLETVARGPWFLGERFSAIDLYIGVMVHWRPRREWFAATTPTLAAIADGVIQVPRLAEVFAANFS
ncbi:MAG: glutathione S-transferase family protein [Kofleriaceae bacterium]